MRVFHLLGALAIAGSFVIAGCGDKGTSGGAGGTTGGAAATSGGGGAAMSDDDAHKLYQAAAQTGDTTMIMDVNKKLGLIKSDGTPDTDKMTKFSTDHGTWAQKNVSFIQEMNDKAKATDYVKKHM
jgi:hypothetical protein